MNTITPGDLQPAPDPQELRHGMVDHLITHFDTYGPADVSSTVLDAMRAMPRHAFLPKSSVTDAYAQQAVAIKHFEDGAVLSCASDPVVVAMMLHQLQVRPGNRVLEIGAGTGYNAALLAELAGPDGGVVTVDVDEDVTAAARTGLAANGYDRVKVVTGDGQLGHAGGGPYDRIIATVGIWDIPTPWWDQLADGGRMVVPLRWRGQSKAVAFTRDGDQMVSDSVQLCGFVPMVGDSQNGERTVTFGPDDALTMQYDADTVVDVVGLGAAVTADPVVERTGVTVGPGTSFDGTHVRIGSVAAADGCTVIARDTAVRHGLRHPSMPVRLPGIVADNSLAYLNAVSTGVPREWELTALGFGPRGTELASAVKDVLQQWDTDRTAVPTITAYRHGVPADATGVVVTKPQTSLTITY